MARLDGLPSLAAQLFQRGTCCQVITPSSAAELDACLQRHGCERCLPLRLCGDQAALPEPDGLLLAASRLAIAPRRCLAIVDGPRGLEAARAAGCGTLRLGRRPDRPSWVGAEIRAIAHFIAGQRT
ncbi:MAG: HAD hydrolase-like protein [Planctomycetota bacterium]